MFTPCHYVLKTTFKYWMSSSSVSLVQLVFTWKWIISISRVSPDFVGLTKNKSIPVSHSCIITSYVWMCDCSVHLLMHKRRQLHSFFGTPRRSQSVTQTIKMFNNNLQDRTFAFCVGWRTDCACASTFIYKNIEKVAQPQYS